jgi:hypothetical protein
MSDEKEKLTDAPVEETPVEENLEDYFNPFAEETEEDKEVKKEIDNEEGKKEEPVKNNELESKVIEIESMTKATREVAKYIIDKPEFVGFSDELIDLAGKAMAKGHSKPLEFAVRNVKSPDYWLELGRKQAQEALSSADQTRIGGSSAGKGAGGNTKDYSGMATEDFLKEVAQVEGRS